MLPTLTVIRSCMTVLLLLTVSITFAQKTISGKVTNSLDQPVPGATVQLRGTKTTTQTDAEGVFSIKIPSGKSVLDVSFVGFEKMEMPVDDSRTSVTISLKE